MKQNGFVYGFQGDHRCNHNGDHLRWTDSAGSDGSGQFTLDGDPGSSSWWSARIWLLERNHFSWVVAWHLWQLSRPPVLHVLPLRRQPIRHAWRIRTHRVLDREELCLVDEPHGLKTPVLGSDIQIF